MTKEDIRIALVNIYIGKLPDWIDLYVESCKHNSSVDWLIFTDNPSAENRADNVKFIGATIKDFNLLASKKIGLKINIINPYKLCDLKPAFGIIFEDYLRGYDFWGCGEIDLIFGDIRKFITDEILTNHDIIGTRTEYLTGHFALYKNDIRMKKLYEMSPDYKTVFQSHKFYNFEECNFEFGYSPSNVSDSKRDLKIESMTYLIKRLMNRSEIKPFLQTMSREDWELKGKPWKLHWNHGKLIDLNNNEELLYLHFRELKNDIKFLIPRWHKIPTSFFITKNGIFYDKEINSIKRLHGILKNYLRIKTDVFIGYCGHFLLRNYPTLYFKIKSFKIKR